MLSPLIWPLFFILAFAIERSISPSANELLGAEDYYKNKFLRQRTMLKFHGRWRGRNV